MNPDNVVMSFTRHGINSLRAKRIFANSTEKAKPGDVQLSSSQKYGVISQKDLMDLEDSRFMEATSGTDNFKHIEAGDFLISLRSFEGGIEYANQDGCVSPAYTVLKPSIKIDRGYFKYLLKSSIFLAAIAAYNTGIRDGKTIRYEDFGEVFLPCPELHEQKAISATVDRETSRIDALIAKKARFIELLNEKRRAIITHAVTKGFDPKVKMKESGVEWIGRIPNHWRIGNIKMLLAEVEYGLSEAASDFGDVEFLTMGNVQNGEVIRTRQKFLSDVPKHMLLREGDILFNRTNSLDLVGKVGIFRERESDPVTFASYLVRLRCKEQINPEYLTYYLGCDPFLAVARTMALPSVSQANLNPNRYGFLPAPIPPKKEQDAIVDVIAASEKRLKHLVSKTQTSIDLLKERRSALITAAVTGQIDLREAS